MIACYEWGTRTRTLTATAATRTASASTKYMQRSWKLVLTKQQPPRSQQATHRAQAPYSCIEEKQQSGYLLWECPLGVGHPLLKESVQFVGIGRRSCGVVLRGAELQLLQKLVSLLHVLREPRSSAVYPVDSAPCTLRCCRREIWRSWLFSSVSFATNSRYASSSFISRSFASLHLVRCTLSITSTRTGTTTCTERGTGATQSHSHGART